MNIALWIVAGLLAVGFVASGGQKLTQSKERLVAGGAWWAEDFGTSGVKAIGLLEVAGAVGLILPALLDIAPVLVGLAGLGLALLMAGAMVFHIRYREFKTMTAPAILLAMAAFVAWGRLSPESF